MSQGANSGLVRRGLDISSLFGSLQFVKTLNKLSGTRVTHHVLKNNGGYLLVRYDKKALRGFYFSYVLMEDVDFIHQTFRGRSRMKISRLSKDDEIVTYFGSTPGLSSYLRDHGSKFKGKDWDGAIENYLRDICYVLVVTERANMRKDGNEHVFSFRY